MDMGVILIHIKHNILQKIIMMPYMEKTTVQFKAEAARERFKRLASLRTTTVLKRLKVLGNCANRNNYEYSEEEVNKIFSEIEKKVREVKARFKFSNGEEKFSL